MINIYELKELDSDYIPNDDDWSNIIEYNNNYPRLFYIKNNLGLRFRDTIIDDNEFNIFVKEYKLKIKSV